MKTAVVTPVHRRHDHLRRQEASLARGRTPDDRIVVAMLDPEAYAVVGPEATVVDVDGDPAALPLAAARNLGAEAALAAGAELLVFLDVDCLAGPDLLARYADAARRCGDALLSGPVAYLPPPPEQGYELTALDGCAPHPARTFPPPGELRAGADPALFWSLSFALTASAWERIGGFDEAYAGYGGEDTDFALRAATAGVASVWVGGATAYHQWHPVSSPPVEHLDAILRNGALFERRWGHWPMEGWLREFAALGLVEPDGDGGWVRAVAATGTRSA